MASRYRSTSEPSRGGEGRGGRVMDRPTAERALKELEPLVGEWTLEVIPST
jgi:hypothetical protein